jgi:hypothetical protein
VKTLRLTKQLLAQEGPTRPSILSTCQQALKVVGERYERQEYYISGLIMAGELFKEVLEMVQPPAEEEPSGEPVGTVVLGTVAKDIHDIGKRLFGTALRGFGFRVVDLGVDVPAEAFMAEVLRSRPDVLCLSDFMRIREHEADRSLGARTTRARVPSAVIWRIIVAGVQFVGGFVSTSMEGVRSLPGSRRLRKARGCRRSPGFVPCRNFLISARVLESKWQGHIHALERHESSQIVIVPPAGSGGIEICTDAARRCLSRPRRRQGPDVTGTTSSTQR